MGISGTWRCRISGCRVFRAIFPHYLLPTLLLQTMSHVFKQNYHSPRCLGTTFQQEWLNNTIIQFSWKSSFNNLKNWPTVKEAASSFFTHSRPYIYNYLRIQTVSKTECGCNNIPFVRSRDLARVSTAKKHETRPWEVTHSQAPGSRSYAEPMHTHTHIYTHMKVPCTRGNGKVSLDSFDSLTTGRRDLSLRDKNTRARRFRSNGPRHFCHKVINKRHSVIATVQPWLIRPFTSSRVSLRNSNVVRKVSTAKEWDIFISTTTFRIKSNFRRF